MKRITLFLHIIVWIQIFLALGVAFVLGVWTYEQMISKTVGQFLYEAGQRATPPRRANR